MSAYDLKTPKTEVIEGGAGPPISSLTPNHPPVKQTSSNPASSSAPGCAPIPVVKANPVGVASASYGLTVPKTEMVEEETSSQIPNVPPVSSTSSALAPPTDAVSTPNDKELREMKKGFFQITGEFCHMKGEFFQNKGEFLQIQEEFCQRNEELQQTREELRQTKEDLRDLKEQFSHINGEFLMTKGEFLQMKGEFLQMKGEFCQGNEEMAKLTEAFYRKSNEVGELREMIQAQLFTILNALPRKDAPIAHQNLPRIPMLMDLNLDGPPSPFTPQQSMGGSTPFFFPTPFTPSFDSMPVESNPPVPSRKNSSKIYKNLLEIPIVPIPDSPVSSIQQKSMECSLPSNSESVPVEAKEVPCILCHANTHDLGHCTTFPTAAERRAVMMTKNLCLKCLQPLNNVKLTVHVACFIENKCEHCSEKGHRSLFCENRGQNANKVPADKTTPAGSHRHAPY